MAFDLNCYQRSRKTGVGIFGVTAYRHDGMLFSISYLRSNRSVFWEFAEGLAGIVVVLWFPHPLSHPFVINNLTEESSVFTARRGFITYQATAEWQYEELPISRKEFASIRWTALDLNVKKMLLSNGSLMKVATFADAISVNGGRFRIEERGICAIFPAGARIDRAVLEKGHVLWEDLKDRQLPKQDYRPLKNPWNVFILILVLITIAVIGHAAYEGLTGNG